jgi:hypothetical protein
MTPILNFAFLAPLIYYLSANKLKDTYTFHADTTLLIITQQITLPQHKLHILQYILKYVTTGCQIIWQ